jgi:hypothetical protein
MGFVFAAAIAVNTSLILKKYAIKAHSLRAPKPGNARYVAIALIYATFMQEKLRIIKCW